MKVGRWLFIEGLFIARFKVGSLTRMINKEVLAQFIYTTT